MFTSRVGGLLQVLVYLVMFAYGYGKVVKLWTHGDPSIITIEKKME